MKEIEENFLHDIANHTMTVKMDDGVYRHLRCQEPGTWIHGFDIITWPGHLAFVGDMGDYLFSRLDDMFEFFGSDGINPDYWSEKVKAHGYERVREFSAERYKARVLEWLDEELEGFEYGEERVEEFRGAVYDELLTCLDLSEREAYDYLYDFRWEGIRIQEPFEWSFREFTYHYLWACYAIVWAIGQYEKKE